jgi:hypothetical protein
VKSGVLFEVWTEIFKYLHGLRLQAVNQDYTARCELLRATSNLIVLQCLGGAEGKPCRRDVECGERLEIVL